MSARLIPKLRFDPLALAILLATAAVVRVVLGYRSFPSVDDFTYVPLGWARLDPSLFPRDEILLGLVNHVPIWPAIIWLSQETIGLAEGLFSLTLLMTLATLVVLRQLLRGLGGSDLFLPLAVALAVTVNVRGIGRGAFDGVLGDAFHMQWLALTLVLGAYAAFVRGRPVISGVYLGAAACVHPLVAAHGAFTVALAGLLNGKRGLTDVLRTGLVSFLAALPASISLVREVAQKSGTRVPVSESTLIRDTVLFRTPHHYDLDILPFLVAALLGLAALAALTRLGTRAGDAPRRFYGLLLGHAVLLLATFVLHGPYFFKDRPLGPFFLYTLDVSRSTPLFFALCGVGVAAALPRPDEPLASGKPRRAVDRVFAFSAMFCVACLLLVNLRHDSWSYVLLLFTALAYSGLRHFGDTRGLIPVYLVLAAGALVGFLRHAEVHAISDPTDQALYAWAQTTTPTDALFIVPPGFEAFRMGAKRAVYVDFKLLPPTQPSLAWKARMRLEEVANPDARALERARGWSGIYWWDVAYAKRNPPQRIAGLLRSTGADYFVQDRLYLQLPPHLPSEAVPADERGLAVAFENSRYRVYRLEAGP